MSTITVDIPKNKKNKLWIGDSVTFSTLFKKIEQDYIYLQLEDFEWKKDNKKKYTLKDLEKLQFKSWYKDTSENIDKLVYNI